VLSAVLYPNLTLIGMRAYASPAELGTYAVAFGTFGILLVVPTSATMALFPLLAAGGGDRSSASRAAQVNLLLAAPVAAAALLFTPTLVHAWLGSVEPASVHVLRVLAVALVPCALNFSYRLVLFAQDRPGTETAVNVAAVAAVGALALPAVSLLGGFGVALLYLAVECAALVAKTWLTARQQGVAPATLLPPGLSLALLFVAVAAASMGAPRAWRIGIFVAGVVLLVRSPMREGWRNAGWAGLVPRKAGPWPA
jgi:O-antigen/teichoic acid export membrane protein